jgi:probable HAF family extracellular repeat protein
VAGASYTTGDAAYHAYLWKPTMPNGASGAMVDLETLGGMQSFANGVNASGQVTGESSTTDDAADHAFLWKPTTPGGASGTMHDLETLGGTNSHGYGINVAGHVTGASDTSGDTASHAFLWKPSTPNGTSGTMHDLLTLGGTESSGSAINTSGQVVGSSLTTGDAAYRGFLWKPTTPNGTSGTMHDLLTLGGTESFGSAINASGQVAGFSYTTGDAAYHAYLWTPTTPNGVSGAMQDLLTLGGLNSYSYNVGVGGQVVGASEVDITSDSTHAFLYTSASGMIDLNSLIDPLSGWELSDAAAINEAGQITGQGLIGGEYHGYLLTPVSTIPGDFNGDSSVDAADLASWKAGFGASGNATRSQGDADGDLDVDGSDFLTWQRNLGGAAMSVSPAPVPEPLSVVLALLGIGGLQTAGRSRRWLGSRNTEWRLAAAPRELQGYDDVLSRSGRTLSWRCLVRHALVALALPWILVPRLLHAQPVVGAYYYPWYGTFSGGHSVNQSLRGHLTPKQPPALGQYSNRNNATIASHIDQSHQGNIDFWAVSWWGPQSAEDTTLRTSILAHPRQAELQYAVHYESPGRLGTFENPNFNNLIPDFRYLATNYFQNPSYLKIDGRPVVFMYVTRAYFNTQTARDAVTALRTTMNAEFGLNPYIVGDDVFGSVDLQRAQLWDAITDFDVYGTALQTHGSTSAGLSHLASVYDNARAAIAGQNIDFIPTASPGFNDKGVRTGHPAAPRYMVDDPQSEEGDLFARMLSEVVVPRVDPNANNILMINSFNEWHEDTQIEPSIVAPRTNVDDSGTFQYSEGKFYEGYGSLYLDLLRAATEPMQAGDFNLNGTVDGVDLGIWRAGFGSRGPATRMQGDADGDLDVDGADFLAWQRQSGSSAATAATTAVPEPALRLLLTLAAPTLLVPIARNCRGDAHAVRRSR